MKSFKLFLLFLFLTLTSNAQILTLMSDTTKRPSIKGQVFVALVNGIYYGVPYKGSVFVLPPFPTLTPKTTPVVTNPVTPAPTPTPTPVISTTVSSPVIPYPTGNGIVGLDSLNEGQSVVYQLRVNGVMVGSGINWSASYTGMNDGTFQPPANGVVGDSRKGTIFAVYNGVRYTKSIYITDQTKTAMVYTPRLVTDDDHTKYPQMRVGIDYIVPGATMLSGTDQTIQFRLNFKNPLSFPAGQQPKVFLKGGKYKLGYFCFSDAGSRKDTVYITSYEGRVIFKDYMQFEGATYVRVTGAYEPENNLGQYDYPGHKYTRNYARDLYSIVLDNEWNNENATAIKVYKGTKNIRFDNLRIGNGYFAGFFLNDTQNGDFDSFQIDNNFVHDTHGEGIYAGQTSISDPQWKLIKMNIFYNLFVRTGYESIQLSQLVDNSTVMFNIGYMSSTNFYGTHGQYQDRASQISVRNGGLLFKNNLFYGWGTGSGIEILIGQLAETGYVENGLPVVVSNNAFLGGKGAATHYFGVLSGKKPILTSKFSYSDNITGLLVWKSYLIHGTTSASAAYNPNVSNVINYGIPSTMQFTLDGNIHDGSGSKKIWTNSLSTNLLIKESKIDSTILYPDFENSGWPINFDVSKVYMYQDTINKKWNQAYGSLKGQPVVYVKDEIVVHKGNFYKVKVDKVSNIEPSVANYDLYYAKLYWNPASIPSLPIESPSQTDIKKYNLLPYPPDNLKLKADDSYKKRAIGF